MIVLVRAEGTATTATADRTGEEGPATVVEMDATASTTGAPAPEGSSWLLLCCVFYHGRPHYRNQNLDYTHKPKYFPVFTNRVLSGWHHGPDYNVFL